MVGFVFQIVTVLIMSILFTWIFNSARGSILMVALVHGGLNTFTLGAGEQIAGMLTGFILVAAIVIIGVFKRANLSCSAKQTT